MEQGQETFEHLEHRAKMEQAKVKEEQKKLWAAAQAIIMAALDVLSKRIFLFVSLAAIVSLFAWAMAEPLALRTVTACLGAGFILTYVHFNGDKNAD